MGSFKGKGRGQGSFRSAKGRSKPRTINLELLEERCMLTGGGGSLNGPPTWHPTNSNLSDALNGPMANAGTDLINIYSEYQAFVSNHIGGEFNPAQSNIIFFQGNDVGIDIRGFGNQTSFVTALQNMGMQIANVLPQTNETYVAGFLPVAELPAAAEMSQTIGLDPSYKPTYNFIGVADNQGEAALKANTARTQFGVTGAGVTVGVISDSVNQFQLTPTSPTGIAASVATGDIPSASRVTVLSDGPAGSSDEGRAMIENIFDIAPGVNTAFATSGISEAAMASAITNLASVAKASVIVDDVTFFTEPMFQTGIIGAAVDSVVSKGVSYFSSAGNNGSTGKGGYESGFRGVNTSVTGVGTGTFFNFNPNGGTMTNLPITATAGGLFALQWDDPFYTTNGVVTNVFAFVLDANNNVVASGTTNAIANQRPEQIVQIPAAGNYTLVLQVQSGPNPGTIRFNQIGDQDITFTQPFGNAGNVLFPTSFGHNADPNAVGTGAVPWWGTPTFLPNLSPDVSEFFSGLGPQEYFFNPDGSRMSSVQKFNEPLVSGVDGGNTSFFTPGQIIDTSNPPFPGEPATATNLSQNLPTFFGTSSAAPNLAAVAALMKQLTPGATPAQISAAMVASAHPLNGGAQGQWNVQGGFGLVDATTALATINTLRVSSIVPGGGATVTTTPTDLIVTFNKPVVFSTVVAADLNVAGPAGTTVTVGTPIAIGNATNPTVVDFPIVITRTLGVSANGIYIDAVAGQIKSTDGQTLTPDVDSFNLADTIPPTVTGLTVNGRIIKIAFSEAIDARTVNSSNFVLIRANNNGGSFTLQTDVTITADPRVLITYNPASKTVTIDLSALPQSLLPTDFYALGVTAAAVNAQGQAISAGVTDVVGNSLSGVFNGTFPSGNGKPGSNFFFDFGPVTLGPPIINNITLTSYSPLGITSPPNNTNVARPTFTGQLGANFPGTVSGVEVLVEFNGLAHNNPISGVPEAPGTIDLNVGANGRGFVGNFDVLATTNAAGQFTVTAPANLPDGFNIARFVVIGPSDRPPLPGFATAQDFTFRVDTSLPTMDTSGTHPDGTTIPQGAQLGTLSNMTLFFTDPVKPSAIGSPFAVPTLFTVPALNPATAINVSNYSLYLVQSDGTLVNKSSFIQTATYVSTSKRVLTSDPFTGQVALTFATGLPAGNYIFVIHKTEPGFQGVADAAGNPLGGDPAHPTVPQDYFLTFTLQPSPVFITSDLGVSPDGTVSMPRAYYEEPAVGTTPRAASPPQQFVITFSNPLNPNLNYLNDVQLIGSADTAGGTPDGNFGTLGITNTGVGYNTIKPNGTTVRLQNGIPGATLGQPGFQNQLVLTLPSNFTLPPDYYRLYMPNSVAGGTAITDAFGNQLDGEFLGDLTASNTYEDLLPNGQYRQGLTGDGIAGGAFMTGFTVVPNGNIIYANPSYASVYNPFDPNTYPDGSLAKPFPVLAPEAIPNAANGGDLNSPNNAGTNFNPSFDRSGLGVFEPSAFFAAQLAAAKGPVVIVAEPGNIIRNPNGTTTQATFVLQAPSGIDPVINDGSAAIPALTTLVFQGGSTLKLENAALLVQNQGSALQANGNSSNPVTFTSFADDSVAGDTNNDGNNTTPHAGDWGGILFRNFNQANRSSLFPGQIPTTGIASQDQRLKNAQGGDAISGADDIMSVLNFSVIKYGGGDVPQTTGFRYDALQLQNSAPAITNSLVADTGGSGSSQAALSVDVDSLRADDSDPMGPLFRRLSFASNTLNGIYIRAQVNGVAEPSNAINYPSNPSNAGGVRNFVLDSPYPYLLTTPLIMGSEFLVESGGATTSEPDRLYVQPGMMMKLDRGAGIQIQGTAVGNRRASINVGDRTYINEWDANPNISPSLSNGQPNPAFKANSTTLANALFTSIYDNTAQTFFTDPTTGIVTQIVAPLDSANSGGLFQPVPGQPVADQARWGGIEIDSPAVGVINGSTIEFGGGFVNTASGTTQRYAINLVTPEGTGIASQGAHVMITDNNFFDNLREPISINANGLFAGNEAQPLTSGAPFFHLNVLQRNEENALMVQGDNFRLNADGSGGGLLNDPAATVNTVWPGSDITYLLTNTITLGPAPFFQFLGLPSPNQLDPIPPPSVTLTIQSVLPGTILADGTVVPNPGISPIVKLQGAGPSLAFNTTPNISSNVSQGAGFVTGMDNGVDPTPDPFIDSGLNSSLRFLGIPANQTTGQTRVPVILTSIHDSTVGTTVRGVTMNQVIPNDPTGPKAGDGGNIVFGSFTQTTYNLLDPRQGNLIDNTDIKFITSIQQQADGVIQLFDVTGTNSYNVKAEPNYLEKLGLPLPLPIGGLGNIGPNSDQLNQVNALTLSDSNFSTFSEVGFFAHPGFGAIFIPENYPGSIGRGVFQGEPSASFLINDTWSNMPIAVDINYQNDTTNTNFSSPAMAVVENNTFFQNGIGLGIGAITVGNTAPVTGPQGSPTNWNSSATVLSMNNIYDNSSVAGIEAQGQVYGSQSQYDLFFGDASTILLTTGVQAVGWSGNSGSSSLNPQLLDPTNGNFTLQPNSAAIDAGRSELGPAVNGDMMAPIATQLLNAQGGVRNTIGRTDPGGGSPLGFVPSLTDFVTLPGDTLLNFVSEWVPALTTKAGSIGGPASNAGTYNYLPISGERDQRGNLRVDDPSVANLGAGSSPFFDIGAFEFVQTFPPHVTAVTANFTDPTSPTGVSTKNIYSVGGIAGTNVSPLGISVQLDHQLNLNTINTSTVLLEKSTDGNFNGGASDSFISLAGKITFNSSTDTLSISLGASGVFLDNAEYRLILFGTGSQVLRDPQGNALDGANLDANGNQRALPSGNGFPGSNFQVTFTVDTHPPAPVNGTFQLAPTSDSNRLDRITNVKTPTFTGSITDVFPPANPLAGDTVIIDISTKGNGVFDDLNAGVGLTDAQGNYSVTLTNPIPDSPWIVGPSGIFGPNLLTSPVGTSNDDGGFTQARVRIVDQSGNQSILPSAPLSQYLATGALTTFAVDTVNPHVTGISPVAATVTAPVGGVVPVTVAFDVNIDPASLNTNSIQVLRSGGDGIFGNGNDVPMQIDPNSLKITYLHTPKGAMIATFNIIGTSAAPIVNDNYRITLKGTGANTVFDIPGNPLDGQGIGKGSDFVSTFVVFSQTLSRNFFVGPAGDVTNASNPIGDITNPYPTIARAIAAASTGDVVAVLPGVYTESITLKSLVTVESASLSSSDAIVLPGDPLQTIIRAPQAAFGTPTTTVTGTNLQSIFSGGGTVLTKLSGFSIASPLAGNPASGPIQQGSIGLSLINSAAVVANDFFVDSDVGIQVQATGSNASLPMLLNDGVIGNNTGVQFFTVNASSFASPAVIENNDIAFNTFGVSVTAAAGSPLVLFAANTIFWQNHALDESSGFAVGANQPNLVVLLSNMFSSNGPNLTSPNDDTFNIGGGFDPAALKNNSPDVNGNFLGTPAFVAPRDPRPTVDGPAVFFLDGNFDLTTNSSAIDRANGTFAPATDILFRGRVNLGRGFPGTGPADVGAYEFDGTGGIASGSTTFSTTSTTLFSGATPLSTGSPSTVTTTTGSAPAGNPPSSFAVRFSAPVNQSTVSPLDLVFSGSGLSVTNPLHATSLTWIDSETVDFNLAGGYSTSGTVNITIRPNTISSAAGAPLAGLFETLNLTPGTVPTAPGTPVLPPIGGGGVTPTSNPTSPVLNNNKKSNVLP
jgi:large repetitive protein